MFEIVAPARLHFGLFAFGDPNRRQFGGVGAMLSEPALRLRFSVAPAWSFAGPHAERIQTFVERALSHQPIAAPERRCFKVETPYAVDDHIGLGSGTQLGLAAAYGALYGQNAAPETLGGLMAAAGRGKRSSVGGYGFLHGGLIVEAGKFPGEAIAPLIGRALFPSAWRVVLITPRLVQGLSGLGELTAFAKLPAVPGPTTDRLIAIATDEILPAVKSADFSAFADGVYRFGYAAGECFAAVQGGPFANARIAEAIARLRALGILGVGQTSWGPTVYAWFPDDSAARDFLARHEREEWLRECDTRIATPAHHGATLAGRPVAASMGE